VSAVVLVAWAIPWVGAASHPGTIARYVGGDLNLYLDATRRWLDGGGFYLPHQLAGPYDVDFGLPPGHGDVLYPPPTILLFLPFLVLPAALCWILPLGATGWAICQMRPAPITWPVMAACLLFGPFNTLVIYGNPVIWMIAAVALGALYGGPAILVFLKPSLLPFVLVGLHRRAWRIAAGIMALVALAFAPMWPDYAAVLLNARNPHGLAYSLAEFTLLLLPIVAYLGRTTPDPDVPSWTGTLRGWRARDGAA
jgi:hypothetical protein